MTDMETVIGVEESGVELTQPQSIYDLFETEESLELNGVWFDYSFGSFKLAYVGGANQSFQRAYSERMKPYIEAEARGMLDDKIRRKIQIECYVDHVLRDWKEVIGRDNSTLVYSKPNAIKLFNDLPQLFGMIRSAATNFANYRRIYADQVAGN